MMATIFKNAAQTKIFKKNHIFYLLGLINVLPN